MTGVAAASPADAAKAVPGASVTRLATEATAPVSPPPPHELAAVQMRSLHSLTSLSVFHGVLKTSARGLSKMPAVKISLNVFGKYCTHLRVGHAYDTPPQPIHLMDSAPRRLAHLHAIDQSHYMDYLKEL